MSLLPDSPSSTTANRHQSFFGAVTVSGVSKSYPPPHCDVVWVWARALQLANIAVEGPEVVTVNVAPPNSTPSARATPVWALSPDALGDHQTRFGPIAGQDSPK